MHSVCLRGMQRDDWMSDGWRPIGTAPCDGTKFQVRMPGYGEKNLVLWRGGLLTANGEDTSGWHYVAGDREPSCWSDGVCWDQNEDGQPSIQPTEWKMPDASFCKAASE